MAYKYCDWATGDDSTGDGSYTLPWKTITKLTTSWNGTDILRVGKSPDNAALSGTLTFTAGSTTLSGSGTAFTTELAIGDFVLGANSVPYEVITISSNTAAVLYKVYPSSTQSGVACVKVGMTSTGAAAASSTQIQIISSSGTSAVANMMISGGWDLSTQTQTGVTNFKQMHGTFATRNGYGLYATGKSYFTIEKCGFFRYNFGIYFSTSSNYNTITTPICNSNNTYGICFGTSSYNTITTPACNSNNGTGIAVSASSNVTITTPTCNSNNTYGVLFLTVTDSDIDTPICDRNNSYGIRIETSSNNNTITTPTCNSNTNYGIVLVTSCYYNTITTPTCNSNGGTGVYISASCYSNTITTPTCNSNTNYGIRFATSSNNTITTPTCNSNNFGIYISDSSNNVTITTPTCNSNNFGIYISDSSNVTITTPTCNSNTTNAFYANASFGNVVNKFSGTGNVGVTLGSIAPILEIPSLSIQYYNAKGTNKNWFYQGITESNTAEADGGSGTCLHYDPSSATLYMSHSFLFKAVDNTAYTLTAKVKKKNSFNGDVQGAVFFLGVPVIDWTDITPTNADAYETKTFNVTSGMVIDNSCLELRIKVRGTAGDIYVDTLGIS